MEHGLPFPHEDRHGSATGHYFGVYRSETDNAEDTYHGATLESGLFEATQEICYHFWYSVGVSLHLNLRKCVVFQIVLYFSLLRTIWTSTWTPTPNLEDVSLSGD